MPREGKREVNVKKEKEGGGGHVIVFTVDIKNRDQKSPQLLQLRLEESLGPTTAHRCGKVYYSVSDETSNEPRVILILTRRRREIRKTR